MSLMIAMLSLRLLVIAAVAAVFIAGALIWLVLQDPVGLGLAIGRAGHFRVGVGVWF